MGNRSTGLDRERQASDNGAEPLPSGDLVFTPLTGFQKFVTSTKLARALPWRRFKKGSVLVIELGGGITEKRQGRFAGANSMPQITGALKKAAYDPRVSGVLFKISPLSAGWAKLQEIRQYIDFFRQSGKYSIAYMAAGGEKEFYVASACQEVYVPPSGSLSLRGLAVSGTFLRTALEKVGVDPNIIRIGKYKSAGDQLLRKDMSEAQREQLTAILEDIYEGFTQGIAQSRGKTTQEAEEMLDEGIFKMERYVESGWLTGLKYEDEILADLEKRTESKPNKLKAVGLKKYSSVSPTAFGMVGRKRIAVIRAAGAIVGGSGGRTSGNITSEDLIAQIRLVAENKAFVGLVLRVDSPGGDALASDLIWRELRVLAEKKPVIASMGDVAASGGYYLSMAARKVVAEQLTITGSIGVITGKFSLEGLYNKVGYAKEVISKGRYAELLADNRGFSEEEDKYFAEQAQYAYESFRNKAALSRGLPIETMQEVAQGRVWSGKRALEVGLVDALGGLSRAVAIAKRELAIPDGEAVALVELSREQPSPLSLLSGGGASAAGLLQV
ncbi:protease IV with duplicated peptidase family U7 domain-containing protein [Coccomyxa subellipsoidea C-169]|uniref:Protease IV with duplicated peptidase family U7 domain-containing protein n=1 Tax=Coccomyxa subellipsoidea (strain C-169) TaxID=574566 RepID=I0YWT6_COCSC|nr:protease IV with duplicated peptidase family U7 domain-containing protein [Coccomyxa subellipsoidea C-169]EIE22855.1 protease IV with duplicated peptidase family U7 domain-containing protein [Coccomyxa subellipsoidea C-169]|eukprot:XP_005647399.1 protease IV with duplicated peptidase family U7 domain-containing protein [Coccomyxa subellipsoidea C-169]